MIKSTIPPFPLTINMILRHGRNIYGSSEVVTFDGEKTRRKTFSEVAHRVDQLGAALRKLGVKEGERVATFSWNHQEHLEAYLAVPSLGAVLHTLNVRLFPDQLKYIINHAEDKVIIVDDSLVPVFTQLVGSLDTVEKLIVVGSGDASALGEHLRYEELLAEETSGFDWPEMDENAAAAMCYTSGTTGNPKGVVYSHRSTWLHSMGVTSGAALGMNENDRLLPVVPMFHANAWGYPYAAWFVGSDLIFPERFVQAEPLSRLIPMEKPTIAAAVPTVWNDLLRFGEEASMDMSSIRMIMCGGAAVPRSLMQRFEEHFGVKIIQGWGMTETSPIAALAYPPKDADPEESWEWRSKTGRIIPGVEVRICDDAGNELPRDGEAVGEIEVRGPWVTSSYYLDSAEDKFHDGWLRTGDVGTLDDHGFIRITDRAKDVIKSGGEWISSVELETLLIGHPDVVEAAVIAVPDQRWDERPLACVVVKEGATVTPDELRDFLTEKVAKWWLPERWAFIPEVPKTSVGKFDKKVLRARNEAGELTVTEVAKPSRK